MESNVWQLFVLFRDSPIDEDIDWVSEECEVVGNVYENPELLMKVLK
ncbi:YopX family protein [Bacillus paranthracis]